jgi:ABC-2 type transport system ATP-binding protein
LVALGELPGAIGVERRGDTVTLSSTDSEATLRALLDRFRSAHDVEVHGAGLEEAFVGLTAEQIDGGHEVREVR